MYVHVCTYGHTYTKSMDQTGKIANRVRGQLGREMDIYLSAFAPKNFVSRDRFDSPVPYEPAHLRTRAEFDAHLLRDPPEFCGGVHLLFILNRHTPSSQSRVYRVTQLRTDGVHYREYAGTRPVNLQVVSNECCLG